MTALGATGSILQFLDFAMKVVTKGNQIYRSGNGMLQEHQDLNLVTSDLLLMKTKLERFRGGAESSQAPENETIPEALLSASTELAKQLLTRLTQAQAQGRLRRWKSLRQALKCVCSKKEVDEMANRLAMYRNQIELRIMTSVSTGIDQNLLQQAEASGKIDQHGRDLLTIQEDLLQIKSHVDEVAHTVDREHHVTNGLINTSVDYATATLTKLIDGYGSNLQRTLEYLKTLKPPERLPPSATEPFRSPGTTEEAILRSFTYPSMLVRPEAVATAHANTFRWLYQGSDDAQRPWDDFTEWLRLRNDIYWITGKAASGKSTLVKYILQNRKTMKELDLWGGDSAVVVASFYFWSLGSSMQRSQCGLLRSLIYSILKQKPSMIKRVLPSLWQQMHCQPLDFFISLEPGWHAWSLHELKEVMQALVTQDNSELKFCLFIDGLDEFDGDHREIADFCWQLSQHSDIKICLSSRPLMVFEEAFGCYSHLQLQDLTRKDIQKYVFDNLSDHPRLKMSQGISSQIPSLTNEVVERASGVFLWVVLVVRSLQAGITNHDSPSDLQRRLDDLPLELDGMYSMMLEKIDPPFYREQAFRLLQLMYHAKDSLSMLELSFANDEDAQLSLDRRTDSITPSNLQNRITTMSAHCRSRCAGLLEAVPASRVIPPGVPPEACPDVNFLHLTVREFLEKPEVWCLLARHALESGFDANQSLLRGSILMFKVHQRSRHLLPIEKVNDTVALQKSHFSNAVFHARQAEASSGRPLLTLTDEIEHISMVNLNDNLLVDEPDQQRSFLEFLVSKGLVLYVKSRYGSRLLQMNWTTPQPLLRSALENVEEVHDCHFGPPMVNLLLHAGLNPNQRVQGTSHTVWTDFLLWMCYQATEENRIDRQSELFKIRLDVCRLFLFYGADERVDEGHRRSKYNDPCPCEKNVDHVIEGLGIRSSGEARFQTFLRLLPNDQAKELDELRHQVHTARDRRKILNTSTVALAAKDRNGPKGPHGDGRPTRSLHRSYENNSLAATRRRPHPTISSQLRRVQHTQFGQGDVGTDSHRHFQSREAGAQTSACFKDPADGYSYRTSNINRESSMFQHRPSTFAFQHTGNNRGGFDPYEAYSPGLDRGWSSKQGRLFGETRKRVRSPEPYTDLPRSWKRRRS